jgi:hypothetical protein
MERPRFNHPITGSSNRCIYLIYNFADLPRPRHDSGNLGGAAYPMKSDPCNYKYTMPIPPSPFLSIWLTTVLNQAFFGNCRTDSAAMPVPYPPVCRQTASPVGNTKNCVDIIPLQYRVIALPTFLHLPVYECCRDSSTSLFACSCSVTGNSFGSSNLACLAKIKK